MRKKLWPLVRPERRDEYGSTQKQTDSTPQTSVCQAEDSAPPFIRYNSHGICRQHTCGATCAGTGIGVCFPQ
jgi:hypothetical protein